MWYDTLHAKFLEYNVEENLDYFGYDIDFLRYIIKGKIFKGNN